MGTMKWIQPTGFNTGLMIYNCIMKQKVPLIVKDKKATSWYSCGPTVYDSAHIGHASSYVKLDILQRILRNCFGLNLITAMNITDVDDKIIKRSTERNLSISELTQYYEKEFWENMKSLNVIKPDVIVRISDYIPLMKDYIGNLERNGYAYKALDNSVYFNVATALNYGKLQNIGDVEQKSEIKKSPMDFALWKAAKSGEPYWESNWGPGRPGWHTECSSLAGQLFGSTIDIHAGGIDLRFPHHENEEAQSCAFFAQTQWVNYWIHTGHLNLKDSAKMSKSLNNTLSINNLLENCSADEFRMMCLMSHYRSHMEFNDDYVKNACSLLKTYKEFVNNCRDCLSGRLNCSLDKVVLYSEFKKCTNEVIDGLKDDFNTASVLKSFNNIISLTNKMLHTSSVNATPLSDLTPIVAILNFLLSTLNVFGVSLEQNLERTCSQIDVHDVINVLNEFRSEVRKVAIENKNQLLLQLCDNVRNDMKGLKVVIKDHGKVSTWSI